MALEVYAFNPRARRVYERAGFVYEGTKREALLWDGEWTDAIVMSILASDPIVAPYFTTPIHDDIDAVTTEYGPISDRLLGQIACALTTSAGLNTSQRLEPSHAPSHAVIRSCRHRSRNCRDLTRET